MATGNTPYKSLTDAVAASLRSAATAHALQALAKQDFAGGLRPRGGRVAFGVFLSEPAGTKQMNLASKPVKSFLVSVRIFSHPKAKPHPGHPTKEAAGSTSSGSGAKRPLPEPVQRERLDPATRCRIHVLEMYEEGRIDAGQPMALPENKSKSEEAEPLSGSAPQGRTPEQDEIAGKQPVNGAVEGRDDSFDRKAPERH